MLAICFARDTVQLVTAESIRVGIDELMNSGRTAESAEKVTHPDVPRCDYLSASRLRTWACAIPA